MNFDKESKSGIFFIWAGGGGEGGSEKGGYEQKSHHILYIRHNVKTSSTQPYSLMKIFLMVFKTEGIVALNMKGISLRKYKNESCHSYTRHIVMTCFTFLHNCEVS